ALGPTRTVGGGPAPSFTNREVTTALRLRDGESHLLAGLLQDQTTKTLTGFPGISQIPILRDLLSENNTSNAQTDIVMLITPPVTAQPQATGGAPTPQPNAAAVGPAGDPQINLRAPQSPTTTLAPTAQVSITAPAGDVRVATGPYTVPIYINGAARISTMTLT